MRRTGNWDIESVNYGMGKLIVMQNRRVKLHVMNWKSGEIDDSEDIYNSGITYDSQPDLKGFLKKCYEPIEKYGLIHYIGKLEVGHLKYIYIFLHKTLRRKNKGWRISIGIKIYGGEMPKKEEASREMDALKMNHSS